ncbi:MAG TPA: hypothetical protein VLG47_01375 [Candidatus Saccharimonadales bacterium]|nr:hypothetical protein [Candidatus Saccharimonadales bacterium]
MAKHKKFLVKLVLLLFAFLPLGMVGLVSAQAVVQSYGTDTQLSPGIIVQLDAKDPTKVKPATQSAIDKIHGVVVSPNDAPVSLQTSTDSRQAYVATTGSYNVLVSDQQGAIAKDDYIALSSVAGVGMKAGPTDTIVLGKALNSFDGKKNVVATSQLKGGDSSQIHLGYVGLDLSLSHNPLYKNSTKTEFQAALERFAQSVAHKPVSLIHIYMALAILFISVIVSGVMMYTGLRGSMLAIGRNPMAKSHILKAMIQSILVSIVILVVGIAGVYLLLKA